MKSQCVPALSADRNKSGQPTEHVQYSWREVIPRVMPEKYVK